MEMECNQRKNRNKKPKKLNESYRTKGKKNDMAMKKDMINDITRTKKIINKKDEERNNIDNNRKRKKNKQNQIRIGTWNVRTLLATGKMKELGEELKRYKSILQRSEERRVGKECRL